MSVPPAGFQRLSGSDLPPVAGAVRTEAADPDEQALVSVLLRRRPGAPSSAGALADVTASRRGHLSHQEFAAAFVADPGDIAVVEAFAGEYGLAVLETSAARRTVRLSGTI